MTDRFAAHQPHLTSPPERGFAVTPDNDADLARLPRALWIGTGGDVAVQGTDGEAVTFLNVPDGYLLVFRAKRVLATGTDAEDIVAVD